MEQDQTILELASARADASSARRSREGGVFLGFILLGILVLFGLPELTRASATGYIRNMPLWLLPALVFVYALWGWLGAGLTRQADTRHRFADNIYFLGFIFTMGSLIASFLPIAFSGGDPSVTEIYRAFGTALLSTALGLILRVLVMQYGPSADETAAQVEEDLVALTRRVADEAREIGEALSQARRGLVRHNEAMVEAVLGATGKRLDAVVEEFGTATQSAADLLRVQADGTRTEAEALRQKISVRADEIVEAARLMAEARTRLEGAMSSLAKPVEELGTKLATASTAAEDTASKLRDDVSRLATTLSNAVTGTERMAKALADFEGGAAGQIARVDAAISGLEATTDDGIDRIVRVSGSAADEITRTADSFVNEAGTLRGQASDFQDALDGAMANFTRIVNSFADELERLRKEVDTAPPPQIYGQAE
ncbi:MAG: hypothetical protein MUE77_09895 [Sandarakinorhabdus sp.]|jgi:hypothetical protein|nr:hypothetical protein [Sandarakinorhabdus sp.]